MNKPVNELPSRFLSWLGVPERAWRMYSPMGGTQHSREHEDDHRTSYGMGIQVRGNVLYLDGIICSDADAEFLEYWFGIGAISPSRFRHALESMEGDVEFRLNSPGGQIAAEVSIRSILMDWRNQTGNRVTEIRVVGLVASAGASLLFTSQATKITTLSSSVIMIHQAQLGPYDSEALRQQANVLDRMTEGSIRQYAKARRMDEDTVREDVMAETWMESSDAIERGYADEELDSVEEADRPGDHGDDDMDRGGDGDEMDRKAEEPPTPGETATERESPTNEVDSETGPETGAVEPPQQPTRRKRRLAWR